MHKKISRKLYMPLCWFGFLIFSASMVGCALRVTPIPTTAPLAGEITLYNWADYMPQSVLDAFTAEYGVKVITPYYETMEEAVAQLRAGQVFDLVVMEHDLIPSLVADGLLAKIDYHNVPNFKNISVNFRDLAFDPDNTHSIPYNYGTTGLIVRSDLVKESITRWADLWDPRYAGRIAVRSHPTELISVALVSLGYPLNSENPQELEAALQHLLDLKSGVIFVDDETANAIPILLSGEAVIMVGWPQDGYQARQENEAITYVLPEESKVFWGDTFVIPANSPNKNTAELFLNFLLRPEISAQIVNEIQYANANEAAYPLINPEIFNDPIIFPPAGTIQKADWYMPLSPAGEKLYAKIWERFLASQP
jgi:spermidine/putrescine transport system substrate-binding protein